jgi:stage II sporulation protein AA (anti-sigma F factor antagonist)
LRAGKETLIGNLNKESKLKKESKFKEGKGIFMSQSKFSYEAKGAVLVIHLPKELDHHNCLDLKYETDLLLAENYVSRIVFDFSNTEFMDSSGIGVLLNRYKQMAGSGGSVAIYGVGAQVHRILNVGGLARLMPCFETKEAALAVSCAV